MKGNANTNVKPEWLKPHFRKDFAMDHWSAIATELKICLASKVSGLYDQTGKPAGVTT